MKIILPVAGKGTRLRPQTLTRAKSLVQVAGATVLEHIINRLEPLAAAEYIFITDDLGEQIRSFMTERYPHLHCSYYLQRDRLGPAHAVLQAAPSIAEGDDVLVVFNDTIFITDLQNISALVADCDGLIYSKEVEDYQRFGVNVLDGDFIVDMVEKPDTPISRLAQVGLYYLKDAAALMHYLEAAVNAGETVKGEYYLPAVFMDMVSAGFKFRAPEIDSWLDCGKPETLLETNRQLLLETQKIHGEIIDSVIIPPVYIGPGTVVRQSVIGPFVTVAENCTIENAVIRNSIIHADTSVKQSQLQHSLIGAHACVVGGSHTVNLGDYSHLLGLTD